MKRVWSRPLAIGAMALPGMAVAILSLRYLLPHPPAAPLNVTRNPFAATWLPLHAALSAPALLIGPLQFLNRRSCRRWHRPAGRVYVACCLCSAPVGLLLALGATTGPVSTAGFGLLSVAWFATTALGYQAARVQRFQVHRRWMIRSYALTFAAVTLRIDLAVVLALNVDFDKAYRAISFLAWIPNLILVEWLLHRGPARQSDRSDEAGKSSGS